MPKHSKIVLEYYNSTFLTLVISSFFTIIINYKIWHIYISENTIGNMHDILQMFSFFLFLNFLIYAILVLLNFQRIQKISYIILLLISAPALYFSIKFNVLFDKTMIQNMLESDFNEVYDLMPLSFWFTFVVIGVLPSIAVWKIPTTFKSFRKRVSYNILQSVGAFILALGSLFPYYAELSSFVRNNNTQLVNSLLPYAPIHSLYKNLKTNIAEIDIVKEIVDIDARINPLHKKISEKPLVLVVIIGETARAKSFNEQALMKVNGMESLFSLPNLIYFNNFWSCGTNTAASLPCMFSTFSKDDYKRSFNKKYENVAEIIKRVGYDTLWIENNSGCKGICGRLDNELIDEKSSLSFMHDGEFYDEALVDNLAEKIKQKKTDQVIFLHQIGSHGPAYFKRVPQKYKTLQPACESKDFGDCSDLEIRNAYDNTIRYTEHIIYQSIEELKIISNDYNTILLYLSDHGESTGEHGFYLHGLPYMLAPEEQIHIPALIWMSEEYITTRDIDIGCMKLNSKRRLSHDNFAHTLLGILDVETTAYSRSLNLFDYCRDE